MTKQKCDVISSSKVSKFSMQYIHYDMIKQQYLLYDCINIEI